MTFCPLGKNFQLEKELYKAWTIPQKLDVRREQKTKESKIIVHFGLRDSSLIILGSSEFTCTKCVTELNRAADASRTKSEIVNSLCCYKVQHR